MTTTDQTTYNGIPVSVAISLDNTQIAYLAAALFVALFLALFINKIIKI